MNITPRLTRSYGTERLYGTVYPDDLIGVGFNTRWGGYYFAISKTESER